MNTETIISKTAYFPLPLPEVTSPLKDGNGNPFIKFSDIKHSELLPPLPQAHFTSPKHDSIVLHVLILIPSNNVNNYKIKGERTFIKDGEIKVYITYTNDTSTESYYIPYMLKFELTTGISSEVKTIEVFLRNDDPETSRGTVTTVKNAS